MKIERISYQKVFPIAQYVNEKIGVEIQVDEGDDKEFAFLAAKELVENWHRTANPHPYGDNNPIYPHAPEIKSVIENPPPPKEINRAEEKIEISIDNANTLEELAEIKKNGFPVNLISHYAKRVKELSVL